MKTILYLTLFLWWGISFGEESRRAGMVRSEMRSYGWETSNLTFEEVGRDGQPVIIKRSGNVVGYYCDESVWERRAIGEPALDGVTRIVFGYDQPGGPTLFRIDDPAEIVVWIAAYRNHTEFERKFGCFVPCGASAGFERKSKEFRFGGGCMCSLALRFFTGDKEVLELKGHLQDGSEIDTGTRNSVLHELAKAKLPKRAAKPATGDAEPLSDPFAERPVPQPTEVKADCKPLKEMILETDGLLGAAEWQKAYDLIARIRRQHDQDYAVIPGWHQQLVFKQAWCALKLGKWNEASNLFECCCRDYPDKGENPYTVLALRGWADAALKEGDKAVALRLYRKYIDASSTINWDNPFPRAGQPRR